MYVKRERRERRSHSERRAATRGALLRAARGLFAAEGYAGVSTAELVRRAGVTRGALYHHFEDKRALFRALVEEVEGDLEEIVLGRARGVLEGGGDVEEAFVAGFEAFLDACARPEFGRVLFVEGPAAPGWGEWHGIDPRHAPPPTEAGLGGFISGDR